MFKVHNYSRYEDGELPEDPSMDGEGWTFETLEVGGKTCDQMFPHAIRATDAKGRQHVYQATYEDGEPVRSHGYSFSTQSDARCEPFKEES